MCGRLDLKLAVSPTARGAGTGEKLLGAIIDRMYKAGADSIYLTVEPENTGAIRLYKKMDFFEKELARDYFGPGEDRLVMVAATAYK